MPDIIGLITGLFAGGNSVFILLGGAFIAAMAAWMRGRVTGARAERGKQAGRDRDALADQLEMHREATDAERKVVRMSDEEARREAMKWSRR